MESSEEVPISHSTKPPKRLRVLEPEPRLAMVDNSCRDRSSFRPSAAAKAKAAKADAELAKPAAVGTKLRLSTRAKGLLPIYSQNKSKKREIFAISFSDCSFPFKRKESSVRLSSKVTLVSV